jgi:hypothetical protein
MAAPVLEIMDGSLYVTQSLTGNYRLRMHVKLAMKGNSFCWIWFSIGNRA